MTANKYGCAYLNGVVKQICQDASSRKKGTNIEFTTAKEINYEVYEPRDNRVTYALWTAAAITFYTTIPKMSYLEILLTLLLTWVSADIYGGITHMVLDHTDVIYYKIPDLWRPALEFQWHHLIPHDIVDKPVMCVLGDLNRAIPLRATAMMISGFFYGANDPIYHFSMFCMLIMSYIGQLSHRLTHCTTSEKPSFAQPFERILLKKVEHQKHHKDHGMNFAILSGMVNPLLNSMVNIIGLKTVWPYLSMLGLLTFFDCHLIAHHFVPAITSIFK